MGKLRTSALLLLVAVLGFTFLQLPLNSAFADHRRLDESQSLALFKDLPNTDGKPGAWLSIQIIDRFTLKLVVNGEVIFADTEHGTSFAMSTFFDGTILKWDNGQRRYEAENTQQLAGWEMRTTLDRVDIDADTLDDFLFGTDSRGPELTLGIDEDMLEGGNTGLDCAGGNDEGFFYVQGSSGYDWVCSGGQHSSATGLLVADSFIKESFDDNFEIAYNYVGDENTGDLVNTFNASGIAAVLSVDLEWCPNPDQQVFRSSCDGSDYAEIRGTPGEFFALDTGTTTVDVYDQDGNVIRDDVKIAGPGNESTNTNPEATTRDSTAAEPEPSCEASISSLGWILCPVARVLLGALDSIINDRVVSGILSFDSLSNEGQREALNTVWSAFRTIANVGFVIAFFVVIYSAASGGVLSAYDVKRLLPRLLVGAVAVQLSFAICVFLVELFNSFGDSIADIMLAPIGGSGDNAIDAIFGNNGEAASITGTLLSGLETFVSLIFLVLIMFGAVFSMAGVLLMVIVFVLRNMALTVLTVISPLAFVAWILPNTENMFKRWWGFYTQLLALYPIAAAFLASGALVSYVWARAGGGWANQWIAMITLFAPYLVAPKLLELGGAAVNTVVRGARGMQDGLTKNSGRLAGTRVGKQARAGELTSGDSRRSRAFNAATAGILNPRGTRLNPLGGDRDRSRAAARQAAEQTYNEDYAAAQVNQRAARAKARADGYNTTLSDAEIGKVDADARTEVRNKEASGELSFASAEAREAHVQELIAAGQNQLRTDKANEAEIDYLVGVAQDGNASAEQQRAAAKTLMDVHSNTPEAVSAVSQLVDNLRSDGTESGSTLADRIVQDNIGAAGSVPQLYKPNSRGTVQGLDSSQLHGLKAGSLKYFLQDDGAAEEIVNRFDADIADTTTRGSVKPANVKTIHKTLGERAAATSDPAEQARLQALVDKIENNPELAKFLS